MSCMPYRSSFVGRRGRAVALIVLPCLLLATVILVPVFINAHIVPRVSARFEARIADACGCDVTLTGPRFRFLSGRLVVERVDVSLAAPAVRLVAGPVHVRAPLAYLRGAVGAVRTGIDLRPPATGVPRASLDAEVALARIADLASAASDVGLLPPSVTVGVATLALPGLAQPMRVEGLAFTHDAPAHFVRIDAPRRLAAIPTGTVPLSFEVELDYDAPRLAARIAAAPVALPGGTRGASAGDEAPLAGTVAGSLAIVLDGEPAFEVSGRVDLSGLTLRAPVVASEPVGPLDAAYRFSATVDPRRSNAPDITAPAAALARFPPPGRVSFTDGELVVNGVAMTVRPALTGIGRPPLHSGEALRNDLLSVPRRLAVDVELPPTAVARIHRAVPSALRGDLEQIDLEGSLAWTLALRVPLEAIGEMTWEARTELDGFRVAGIPEEVSPFDLNDAFVHVIRDPAIGYERAIAIPPAELPPQEWSVLHSEHAARFVEAWRAAEAAQAAFVAENPPRVAPAADGSTTPDPTYRYVRLAEMSPWVVRAILTAEDGDFFWHDGVNFHTLPRALERNLRAGEVQFGASTISMQLAKTLFLDSDRLISRKLQEVFLVFLMEHQVPVAKERILELYLNTVEFGPGVFGIADAAGYYFDKEPADLDAGEATWLASVLPSPKRFHRYFEDGFISATWFARMRAYYDVMLERGRMTPEEYASAVTAPPEFARRSGNTAMEG